MQAAYMQHPGSAGEIIVGELPEPVLHDNEALVAVTAVAVNHVDTFVRSGGFQTTLASPFVLGRDAVGTVMAVGRQVTAFVPGQRVWTNSMGYDGRAGVTSEQVAIPAERLFAVPANVDPISLVAAVHSAATAAILLQDVLHLSSQQVLLVEGGAGHVGRKLLQIGHRLGATVITTANPKKSAELKRLGSQRTYDYHADFAQQISHDFPQKLSAIVDTSGQVELATNLDLLALKGAIGLVTPPKTTEAVDWRRMYTQSQSVNGFVISHASLTQLQQAGQLINQAMAQGQLLDDAVTVYPFSQASRAHTLLETNQVSEKLVLVPDKDFAAFQQN